MNALADMTGFFRAIAHGKITVPEREQGPPAGWRLELPEGLFVLVRYSFAVAYGERRRTKAQDIIGRWRQGDLIAVSRGGGDRAEVTGRGARLHSARGLPVHPGDPGIDLYYLIDLYLKQLACYLLAEMRRRRLDVPREWQGGRPIFALAGWRYDAGHVSVAQAVDIIENRPARRPLTLQARGRRIQHTVNARSNAWLREQNNEAKRTTCNSVPQ